MPHELSTDVTEALESMRKTLLAVKAEVRATGPIYLLARVIDVQLDLLEHLLQREHEHSGARPLDLQRFTSG
jgi:hypothetical protein